MEGENFSESYSSIVDVSNADPDFVLLDYEGRKKVKNSVWMKMNICWNHDVNEDYKVVTNTEDYEIFLSNLNDKNNQI